jgi:lipopolysaccharide transport system permease protein
MGNYLAEIWRCRYFWITLVKVDLRTRYRRSILGMGWSLLHPIAMTTILCIVFHTIFHKDVRDYAPFLLAGLATWSYVLSSALSGCQCFFQGESYIRQYPAPFAIYPLRTALGGTVHFLIALSVTIILCWYCKGFANLAMLLTLVPVLIVMFVLSWSIAVLAGFANVHFQDTQHLSDVAFQILFYATPVMYPATVLKDNIFARLLRFNPLYYILEMVRTPIVDAQLPPAKVYIIACSTVLILFVAACLTLVRLQRRLVFHL